MAKQLQKISTTQGLLKSILQEPQLVTVIQSLDTRVLGRLIEHIGLEDSGEIIALATTEQLTKLFDEDLWKNARAGEAEKFDASRFATWLEVMLEMGGDFVADRLTEMEDELVKLAFSEQVLVINVDELALKLSEREVGERQSDLVEKALESSLGQEFEQYWVISKNHDSWDAVLSVLLSLDSRHHSYFVSLMERLEALSTDYIEDNGGLFEVLTTQEELQSDAAAVREERREKEGFVPPQQAAAFLKLVDVTPLEDLLASEKPDPITSSYFKNLAPAPAPAPAGRVFTDTPAPNANKMTEFLNLLSEAEVLPKSAQTLLLKGAAEKDRDKFPLMRAALDELATGNPSLFERRTQEVSYLANILIAGENNGKRKFRPAEAVEMAIAFCEEGLKFLRGKTAKTVSLADHDLVKIFRIGRKSEK